MFKGVGSNSISLGSLKPIATDPTRVIDADEVSITTMDKDRGQTGDYGFRPYRAASGKQKERLEGWYDGETEQLCNDTLINYGNGFMVKCNYPITLQVSGEVVTAEPKIVCSAAGYYRTGNITPVAVSITNLVPVAVDVGQTVGDDEVSIVTYNSERGQTGDFGYRPYRAASGKQKERLAGWYDGETEQLVTNIEFAPGEGFVLKCNYPITITLPSPIKADK